LGKGDYRKKKKNKKVKGKGEHAGKKLFQIDRVKDKRGQEGKKINVLAEKRPSKPGTPNKGRKKGKKAWEDLTTIWGC